MTAKPRKSGRKPKPKPKIGRTPRQATPREIALSERRLKALELRKSGFGYREIGLLLVPPCNPSMAFKMVVAALAEIKAASAELVEHVREIELQRLDDMTIKPLAAAMNGDCRAGELVLKIAERRARILGVDAPKKQEHSGPDGGPIPFARIERIIVDPTTGHAANPDPALAAPVLPARSV